jgi:hypothetical protein
MINTRKSRSHFLGMDRDPRIAIARFVHAGAESGISVAHTSQKRRARKSRRSRRGEGHIMRYIRHVLVAAVAALALMLGCTAAMAATTATAKPAEANDSVSINPVGDQSTYEGIPEVQQYATVQAESSEGLPITYYGASGLPPGLSIDNDTGVISGSIPADAAPVTWSVTVTATDSAGTQGSDSFSWSVIDPTTVTNPGNQYSDAGTPVSVQVDAARRTAANRPTSPPGCRRGWPSTSTPA